MNVGMLWFDNDPKLPLNSKVEKAATFYQRKYGHVPDTCLVHPSMLTEPVSAVGRVTVRSNRAILPGHLWIGVEENQA